MSEFGSMTNFAMNEEHRKFNLTCSVKQGTNIVQTQVTDIIANFGYWRGLDLASQLNVYLHINFEIKQTTTLICLVLSPLITSQKVAGMSGSEACARVSPDLWHRPTRLQRGFITNKTVTRNWSCSLGLES